MSKKLVIVESPAKAKTIGAYLGSDYVVESSIGHIRDLPQTAADTPSAIKKEWWGRFGVDVTSGFKPYYVVPKDKKSHIGKLKTLLKDADELLLATDEDREGEAIAWHLLDELQPKAGMPIKRMVFHEITKSAIQEAVTHPRDIDMDLVEAQEARRILDRLFGYEVSPVVWKKVMTGLSAGRVQSVATRLVVDKERDRMAFRSASYWDLDATVDAGEGQSPRMFPARLVQVNGQRVATGADFDQQGQLTRDSLQLTQTVVTALADALADTVFEVRSVEAKPYRRSPYAPFDNPTMLQEAGRKLGMSAKMTADVAQRLFQNGFITYHRTDSTTLSAAALNAARTQVREMFGADYLPDAPRQYASKVKNAQEAHEAIRPAGETFRTPEQTGLAGPEFRLYDLIWKRTIASQMRDAVGETVSVRVGGAARTGEDVVLGASGRTITFAGFLKAYVEDVDDAAEKDDAEARLPQLTEGARVTAASLTPDGHETKAPARFTEASLIKELKERGIGRPSTFASIIETILNRGYVYKKGTALVPSWVAFSVTRLLEEHFARYVDYNFTAHMEESLDEIANGRVSLEDELGEFYFGSDRYQGLKSLVDGLGEIDARALATFPIADGIDLRVGRYGPYVETADGQRANVPDELPPDELTAEKARDLLANPIGVDIELGTHPETGLPLVAKSGRFGPYVTEVLPEDAAKGAKPRTGSLFKSMSLETITLDQAVQLLALPRVVGVIDGEEVTAQNGRYGPYLKKGLDSRTLASEEQLLTVTLGEAEAIYAQPKLHGRGAVASAPLKELGADPLSGSPVVVKAGRYGEYVTDGEYNATLPKDVTVEELTLERAAELLAERRAKGPAKKTAKRGAKKAPAKKSAAKKTAKKAVKKAS